jgi:hypothetical protein
MKLSLINHQPYIINYDIIKLYFNNIIKILINIIYGPGQLYK